MSNELTEIIFVLDRSGSMQSILTDTIGGFNSFLAEQKKLDGRCKLTFVQFDDKYEVPLRRYDIKDVPELTVDTFVPRGMTALHDAIGKTIADTKLLIEQAAPEEKADKVLFVILTDGQENASKEYTQVHTSSLVKAQQDADWEFLFLAANQDAFATAKSYNISSSNAFTFGTNPEDVQKSFAMMAHATLGYRSMSRADAGAIQVNGLKGSADLLAKAEKDYNANT